MGTPIKRKRKDRNDTPRRMRFTELAVNRLNWDNDKYNPINPETHERRRQFQVWDSGTGAAPGLSVLVSYRGTKTYRSTFYMPGTGKPESRSIGRVRDMKLGDVRDQVRQDRIDAKKGIHPKRKADAQVQENLAQAPQLTYEEVVTQFIEKDAKLSQRSWKLTEGHLRSFPWNDRPFTSIDDTDAYDVLDRYIADGHPYKAKVALAWLRKLWRWAWKRRIVGNPDHGQGGDQDRGKTAQSVL